MFNNSLKCCVTIVVTFLQNLFSFRNFIPAVYILVKSVPKSGCVFKMDAKLGQHVEKQIATNILGLKLFSLLIYVTKIFVLITLF